MTGCLQVETAVATREQADILARNLVERHLAACVQVRGPMWSTFWWHEKMERTEEWGCVIKTVAARYQELEQAIRLLHPYEEPEIIAFPIDGGSRTYLRWIEESTK